MLVVVGVLLVGCFVCVACLFCVFLCVCFLCVCVCVCTPSLPSSKPPPPPPHTNIPHTHTHTYLTHTYLTHTHIPPAPPPQSTLCCLTGCGPLRVGHHPFAAPLLGACFWALVCMTLWALAQVGWGVRFCVLCVCFGCCAITCVCWLFSVVLLVAHSYMHNTGTSTSFMCFSTTISHR